jgi:hypothetical protein
MGEGTFAGHVVTARLRGEPPFKVDGSNWSNRPVSDIPAAKELSSVTAVACDAKLSGAMRGGQPERRS